MQSKNNKGKYQSGQMGQTVNLLAYAFGGSNPSLPTQKDASIVHPSVCLSGGRQALQTGATCVSEMFDNHSGKTGKFAFAPAT